MSQKGVSAQRNGAVAIIVPSSEQKDARAHAHGLRVIAVKTIDDALRALHQLGGAPVTAGAPLSPAGAQ